MSMFRLTTRALRIVSGVVLIGAGVLGSATTAGAQQPGSVNTVEATATIFNRQNEAIGLLSLANVPGGVMASVTVSGLTPGEHGIHLHERGVCDSPLFTAAGAHWNPAMREHGLMNPRGSHGGDLPNRVALPNGSASFQHMIPASMLPNVDALIDADGTAVVIHETADDQLTYPVGNSGGRIACGIVSRTLINQSKLDLGRWFGVPSMMPTPPMPGGMTPPAPMSPAPVQPMPAVPGALMTPAQPMQPMPMGPMSPTQPMPMGPMQPIPAAPDAPMPMGPMSPTQPMPIGPMS